MHGTRRYLTVSQFVLVYESVLTGLIVCFNMDTLHNPRELWHMSGTLLRVLGGTALADPMGGASDVRRAR
jgi:hypothetical protein